MCTATFFSLCKDFVRLSINNLLLVQVPFGTTYFAILLAVFSHFGILSLDSLTSALIWSFIPLS